MAKKNNGSETLKKYNTWYSQDREKYRKFAESKRRQTVFTQEHLTWIFDRCREYMIQQDQNGEPLTVAGFMLAARCNRTDFKRMRQQEYDWRLYQFWDYMGIDEETDLQIIHDDVMGRDLHYWADSDGVLWLSELYSDVIWWFYLRLQDQLEQAAFQTSGNVAGAIFALRAIFHWDDKHRQDRRAVEPISVAPEEKIHIATLEEARAAITALGDDEVD